MARNYTFKNQPSSNSSTRSHYGYGTKPTGITIHHWGSTGQKFENVVAWLRGAKGGTSTRLLGALRDRSREGFTARSATPAPHGTPGRLPATARPSNRMPPRNV